MALLGWISVVVGALLAFGLAALGSVVRSGARDASDRRLGWSLFAGALVAIAVPAGGVVLGRHGHPTAAWIVGAAVLVVGVVLLAMLPRILAAAAQP